ncbi:LysR family transcriptional regulator [Ferrovibrio sp.]|uniref:LysR family transcriptional regulator n=1 Tax=Ferrovibrio sp. TaxID=1917215 RepID=UPI003D0C8C46
MEFAWLEDFIALAESGNFSRAAERRHMTQPAFSRRIRLLEDWAGAPLFDRTSQPIGLTDAGLRLRPTVEEVLRRLAQAREELRQTAAEGASALRFAATHSLSLTFFPAWVQRLGGDLALGPIHLISESMQACEQAMLEGNAQFMLCHGHDAVAQRLDATQFTSRVIGEDRLLPLSAPDAQGGQQSGQPRHRIGQDEAMPFLAYSDESGLGRIIAAAQASAPWQAGLKTVFTSHSAAVLRMMARDGRGLAWLPRSLVAEDMAAGHLVAAGNAAEAIPLRILLLRPRARQSQIAESLWQFSQRINNQPMK